MENNSIQDEALYKNLTEDEVNTAIAETLIEVFGKRSEPERRFVIYTNDKNFLKKFDEAIKEEFDRQYGQKNHTSKKG